MDRTILRSAVTKLLSGFFMMALLLFLPAGTFSYWNAWLLMAVLFFPMVILGTYLLAKNPELLRKRLRTKEVEPQQRKVIAWSAVMFLTGFPAAGFSFRFCFWMLPRWVSVLSAGVFLLGYGLYARVMQENAYLSRTVEVQEGQKVIDTGLYGIVRHPMYTSTVLLFCSMPLVLGSALAFLCFLPYPWLLKKRIENEEAVLTAGLPGYGAYKQRVKYRMFPYLW